MSIFKKILGQKENAPSEPAEAAQPAAPAAAPAEAPAPPIRKARMTRIPIAQEDRVYYAYRVLGREIPVFVTNLSGSGLALRKSGMSGIPALAIGSAMEGDLSIRGERAPVGLRVVREDPKLVGCRYEGPSDAAVALIRRHFRLELLAFDMIRINPKYLKQPETGRFSCYRSTDGAELRVTEDSGGLLEFMLSFSCWHVEGGRGRALRVGKVVVSDSAGELRYKGSALVEHADGAHPSVVEAAVRLVELVPVLEASHREWVLQALRSSAKS